MKRVTASGHVRQVTKCLTACPFCGGVTVTISADDEPVSTTLEHFCRRERNQPLTYIAIQRNTREDAIAAWNQRVVR